MAALVKEVDTETAIAPATKALGAMALGEEVDTVNLAMTQATTNKGRATMALAAQVPTVKTTITPPAGDNRPTAAVNPEDMVAQLVGVISNMEINLVATETLEVMNMGLVANMVPLERAADMVALEATMIHTEAVEDLVVMALEDELVDMVVLEKMTLMEVEEDQAGMALEDEPVDMVVLE